MLILERAMIWTSFIRNWIKHNYREMNISIPVQKVSPTIVPVVSFRDFRKVWLSYSKKWRPRSAISNDELSHCQKACMFWKGYGCHYSQYLCMSCRKRDYSERKKIFHNHELLFLKISHKEPVLKEKDAILVPVTEIFIIIGSLF